MWEGKEGRKEIDVRREGQGTTVPIPGTKGDVGVTITGKESTAPAKGGGTLKASAAEVLMHELVTHAIPAALSGKLPKAFTSVEKENIARKQLKLQLRGPDATHTE